MQLTWLIASYSYFVLCCSCCCFILRKCILGLSKYTTVFGRLKPWGKKPKNMQRLGVQGKHRPWAVPSTVHLTVLCDLRAPFCSHQSCWWNSSLFFTCTVGEELFTTNDKWDGVMLWCQELWCHENFVKVLLSAQDSGCGEKKLNLLMQLLYQSVSLPAAWCVTSSCWEEANAD